MKNVIRYTSLFAVVCLLLLLSGTSSPDHTFSSNRLASLDTRNAYEASNFSVQLINPGIHNPAPTSRSQSEPISEPAAMLLLGAVMIGLSIIGKKIFKH